MKKNISTIIIMLILLLGISLLLYPSVSDYINNVNRAKDITTYAQSVAKTDKKKYEKMLSEAVEYNSQLAKKPTHWRLSEEEAEIYNDILDVSDTGVMSYIEIPKLSCTLPIYHGTNVDVLQIAVGHLEGSSLPVGGKSTHCVLSAHRGLPSAKLFTNLDKLVIGDVFYIRTLNETLCYEVSEVNIVLPYETKLLQNVSGEDLCTLMTCTPYGVNTHRLLVRGKRVVNEEKYDVRITADALQIDPFMVAPVIAAPIVIILFISVVTYKRRKLS
ncbi:MAG: class C sortase [Ruminococcus sp.]|nr:class C sortase [Ruminococcus sp.]